MSSAPSLKVGSFGRFSALSESCMRRKVSARMKESLATFSALTVVFTEFSANWTLRLMNSTKSFSARSLVSRRNGLLMALPSLEPLAPRLVQAHAARDGHVEALHRAHHGNGGQPIAGLLGEAAQAPAFGPPPGAQPRLALGLVERLARLVVGAHQPAVPVLQVAHRACDG